MKTPKRTVIISSLLISLCLSVAFWVLSPEGGEWWRTALFFLLSGALSYGIIQYFLSKDIYQRLLPIYRTISGMTTRSSTPIDDGVMTMPLEDTERKVQGWAQERIGEIQGLQEREDFRREFIGNLAHELKTPLFNVQGYVRSLIEGAAEDEKVRERFLEKALINVQRMTRIIEDLDDISHLESGRMEMEMLPMDVVKTAREIAEGSEKKAENRSMTVSITRSEPIMVKGDEFKIGQVFTNLINNAITYGHEGGKVEVSFTDFEDPVLIEVSDDGPGIDPEKLPRIFERFYRVDQSRSRNVGGTGLGLAIVKHILESHGQRVSAKSVVGEGSTFSFALPKAR